MPADRPTKPPSGDSSLSWQIMHISYKIGYLQRTCDQILAAVTARPTEPEATQSGLAAWWRRAKDALSNILLLYRAWRVWRAISWPVSAAIWAKLLGYW